MNEYKITVYLENEGVPHCWIRIRGPHGEDVQHGLACYDGEGPEPDLKIQLQNLFHGRGQFHGAEHLQELIDKEAVSSIVVVKNLLVTEEQGRAMFACVAERKALPPEKITYDLGDHNACVSEVDRVLHAGGESLQDILTVNDLRAAHTFSRETLIPQLPDIAQVVAQATDGLGGKADAAGVPPHPVFTYIAAMDMAKNVEATVSASTEKSFAFNKSAEAHEAETVPLPAQPTTKANPDFWVLSPPPEEAPHDFGAFKPYLSAAPGMLAESVTFPKGGESLAERGDVHDIFPDASFHTEAHPKADAPHGDDGTELFPFSLA